MSLIARISLLSVSQVSTGGGRSALRAKAEEAIGGLQELLDLRSKQELLRGRGFSGSGLVLPCSSTSEDL